MPWVAADSMNPEIDQIIAVMPAVLRSNLRPVYMLPYDMNSVAWVSVRVL